MRAGSDSGTAVGSRQTDWQGRGQTFSFPPSEALLPQISISIKPRLLPGDTRSRGLGGRSRGSSLPPVVSVKRRVVMPPRCLPSAALDSPHLRGAARGFLQAARQFFQPWLSCTCTWWCHCLFATPKNAIDLHAKKTYKGLALQVDASLKHPRSHAALQIGCRSMLPHPHYATAQIRSLQTGNQTHTVSGEFQHFRWKMKVVSK